MPLVYVLYLGMSIEGRRGIYHNSNGYHLFSAFHVLSIMIYLPVSEGDFTDEAEV